MASQSATSHSRIRVPIRRATAVASPHATSTPPTKAPAAASAAISAAACARCRATTTAPIWAIKSVTPISATSARHANTVANPSSADMRRPAPEDVRCLRSSRALPATCSGPVPRAIHVTPAVIPDSSSLVGACADTLLPLRTATLGSDCPGRMAWSATSTCSLRAPLAPSGSTAPTNPPRRDGPTDVRERTARTTFTSRPPVRGLRPLRHGA